MTLRIDRLEAEIAATPRNVRFIDAMKLARHYFGEPRQSGSHRVFKTPWPGDPRINLQEADGGRAKAYQVKQLLSAIETLRSMQPPNSADGQSTKRNG